MPRPRFSRRAAAALLAGALAGPAACADREPTAYAPLDRDRASARLPHVAAPATPAAFFLAPLGPARGYQGAFLADADVAVDICRVADAAAAACDGALLARYARADGTLAVDAAQQLYRADWPAQVAAGATVRVRVLVGGAEVARTHARRPGPGVTAVQVQAAGYTPLGNGSRLPVRVRVETPPADGRYALPGAAAALAAGASPGHGYTPRAADFAVADPALPSIGVSHTTVLVALTPRATVGEVNALLARVSGLVIGGTRAGGAASVLALRLAATTPAARDAALATLRAATGVVAAAAPDALLGGAGDFPPNGATGGAGVAGAERPWSTRLPRFVPLRQLDGAVRKQLARAPRPLPETVVIESGFLADPDVPGVPNAGAPEAGWHGTGVASVIGATPDNGMGVDGLGTFTIVRPVALGHAPGTPNRVADPRASFGRLLLVALDSVLTDPSAAAVRVVNVSLGYDWARANLDPRTSPAAMSLVDAQGAVAAAVLRGAAERRGGTLPVIVSAAGNDSRWSTPLPAALGSPLNAAAAAVRAIVVVGALCPAADGEGERCPRSNVGAHLLAPGHDVPIVVPADADAAEPGHGFGRGTSFAAPHVSAAVAHLYVLDPALPMAGVTANPALDVLRAGAVALPESALQLDAFGAALALDRRPGAVPDRVKRMLVDVDDGSVDGNARVAADGVTPDLAEDADGDGGAGDGRVDLGDFRRWRDWLLDAERAAGLSLDGAPTHPKRDVNRNGRTAAEGDDEGVEPRGDFDGDGRLTRADLATMLDVWQSPTIAAAEVPALARSGDLHVDAAQCRTIPGGVDVVSVVERAGEEGRPVQGRIHSAASPRTVYTVPMASAADVTSAPWVLRVRVRDAAGRPLAETARTTTVGLAGDHRWRPLCARVAPVQDTVHLAAGASTTLAAEVLGAEITDRTVRWSTQPGGGTVTPDGRYTAPGLPGAYVVLVTSVAVPDAYATVTVVVDAAPVGGRVVPLGSEAAAQTWVGSGGGATHPERWSGDARQFESTPGTWSGFSLTPTPAALHGTMTDHSLVDGDGRPVLSQLSYEGRASASVSGAVVQDGGGVRQLTLAGTVDGAMDLTRLQGGYAQVFGGAFRGTGRARADARFRVVDGPVAFTLVVSCQASGSGPVPPNHPGGGGGSGGGGAHLRGPAGAIANLTDCARGGGTAQGALPPGDYTLRVDAVGDGDVQHPFTSPSHHGTAAVQVTLGFAPAAGAAHQASAARTPTARRPGSAGWRRPARGPANPRR